MLTKKEIKKLKKILGCKGRIKFNPYIREYETYSPDGTWYPLGEEWEVRKRIS